MKKITLLLSMLLFTAITFAQVPAATTAKVVLGASIQVDKDVHNYGKIKKNADGNCYFTITNNGSEPLIITRAKGSCGCTVPDWPREPIAPGASAKMKVTYATNRVGPFNKSVTITSNAKNAPSKRVSIKGTVLAPAPEDGAPVNKKASPMMKS